MRRRGAHRRPARQPDAARPGPGRARRARRTSPTRLAFQRTAGDEFQGVLDEPAALAAALELLLRAERLEHRDRHRRGRDPAARPGPRRPRTGVRRRARGGHRAPSPAPGGSAPPAPTATAARALESAVWLWAALLARRTDAGLGGRRPRRPGADLRRDRHAPRRSPSPPSASGPPRPASPRDAAPASSCEFLTRTALEGDR